MDRSWKIYVADLCADSWDLSSRRIQRVIEGIEVLIATDQLSDFAVAGILSSVGMSAPLAGAAAPSIRATIARGARPTAEGSAQSWSRLDWEMPHPRM